MSPSSHASTLLNTVGQIVPMCDITGSPISFFKQHCKYEGISPTAQSTSSLSLDSTDGAPTQHREHTNSPHITPRQLLPLRSTTSPLNTHPTPQGDKVHSASAAAACCATSWSLWSRRCSISWRRTGSPPIACTVPHDSTMASVSSGHGTYKSTHHGIAGPAVAGTSRFWKLLQGLFATTAATSKKTPSAYMKSCKQ